MDKLKNGNIVLTPWNVDEVIQLIKEYGLLKYNQGEIVYTSSTVEDVQILNEKIFNKLTEIKKCLGEE